MKNPHLVNIEPSKSGSDSEDKIQTEPFDKKTRDRANDVFAQLPDITLAISKVLHKP